jgi:hypothetical protein
MEWWILVIKHRIDDPLLRAYNCRSWVSYTYMYYKIVQIRTLYLVCYCLMAKAKSIKMCVCVREREREREFDLRKRKRLNQAKLRAWILPHVGACFHLRTMSHTIYAAKFEQTIIHQHVHLRRESQSHASAHVPMRLYPIDKSLVCLHFSERSTFWLK